MTAAEALARALDYADGRLSHINEYMAMEPHDDHGGPTGGARQVTMALCEFADTQEVVKWSALAVALGTLEQLGYPPPRVRAVEGMAGAPMRSGTSVLCVCGQMWSVNHAAVCPQGGVRQ